MDIKERIIEYISSSNYTKKTASELSSFLNVDAYEFKDFVKALNELEEQGVTYTTNKGYIHNASKINVYIGKIKTVRKYSAICELKDGNCVTIYNENLSNQNV